MSTRGTEVRCPPPRSSMRHWEWWWGNNHCIFADLLYTNRVHCWAAISFSLGRCLRCWYMGASTHPFPTLVRRLTYSLIGCFAISDGIWSLVPNRDLCQCDAPQTSAQPKKRTTRVFRTWIEPVEAFSGLFSWSKVWLIIGKPTRSIALFMCQNDSPSHVLSRMQNNILCSRM